MLPCTFAVPAVLCPIGPHTSLRFHFFYLMCIELLSYLSFHVQVCQYLLYRSENHNCGKVSEAEWTISEEGPLRFQIHYKGGDVAYGSAR